MFAFSVGFGRIERNKCKCIGAQGKAPVVAGRRVRSWCSEPASARAGGKERDSD